MNNAVFEKTMENVRKKQGHLTYNNRNRMQLLGTRTKLSYYKVIHRKFFVYRNGKTSNTHEKIRLFWIVNNRTK